MQDNDICRQIVIELFNDYDKNKEFASGSNGPRLLWTTNKSEYIENNNDDLNFDYAKFLSVNNNPNIIRDIYQKYKVIQMRQYLSENVLILGCGNSPIAFGSTFVKNKYKNKHLHTNCYTINPDLGMNPSIVGQFGVDDFTFLGESIFDEIIFEGFMMNAYIDKDNEFVHTENINTISSIIFLLKENGVVKVNNGSTDNAIFKKNNNCLQSIINNDFLLCDDSPKSYLAFFDHH